MYMCNQNGITTNEYGFGPLLQGWNRRLTWFSKAAYDDNLEDAGYEHVAGIHVY